MTETVIYFLIGFVACFILDWLMLRRFKETYRKAAEVTKITSTGILDCQLEIASLRDDIHKLRNFLTSQASKTVKKVDWEPDDYKDLSAGKFERFGDDEIEEVREHLTTKQRKSIGG